MKTIHEWNDEYSKYHKNKTNKIIHWVCIPLIMFSLLGLLSKIDIIKLNTDSIFFSIRGLEIFIIIAIGYYIKISKSLAAGMSFITLLFVLIIESINKNDDIMQIYLYLGIFIISWIGQFIGHKIEGKKPAFFKDLQFLLIGPLWLLAYIYKKLNIKL
tara:strand:+ start:1122 stop:1595 length:474 start_codon:yes stop_codon:yes gene_type:complete